MAIDDLFGTLKFGPLNGAFFENKINWTRLFCFRRREFGKQLCRLLVVVDNISGLILILFQPHFAGLNIDPGFFGISHFKAIPLWSDIRCFATEDVTFRCSGGRPLVNL